MGGEPSRRSDDLFWRDEVMEATYWMLGEGIETAVTPENLQRFLDAPDGVIERTFTDLTEREYVRATNDGYVFTGRGEREAKRLFEDEFGDIQGFGTAHADCGPECWCHDPAHADDDCPSELDHEHAHP